MDLDISILEETLRVYEECERNQTATAARLNVARSTLQHRLKKISEKGWLGTEPVLEGFRISQSTAVYDGEGNLKAEFVQQKPERGEKFEIPVGHNVKGVSALIDENGRTIQTWVKTRNDLPSTKTIIDCFREAFDSYDGVSIPPVAPSFVDNSLLTVYPVVDAHISMLAWGEESGVDWDQKIAEQVIVDTYAKLIMQSQPSETAMIVNLGDFIHVNDSKNVTPASGHLLDVDSRYQKIIYTGVRILLKLVEMALTKHKKVILRNTAGNHDKDSCVALNVALSLYFSNNPRVTIEDSPRQLWAYAFGTTLLGFYHSHTMKADRAAMALACEYTELWGKSKYRMMMHGHFHQEMVKEVGNVRVEGFQTLAARDEYAASSGYCSGRSATAVTIHETRGEVGRHRVNL